MPPPADPPDLEERFLVLFDASVPRLYRFVARRAGGDRALAEDVTQEAWLRAVEAWRKSGPPERPHAWLERVAWNLLANELRRRPAPASVDPATLDLERASEPSTPPAADAAAFLAWGLARLPPRQARLVAAHHLDGVELAALAREQRLTVRAVEGRLRRARAALRRHLARRVGP